MKQLNQQIKRDISGRPMMSQKAMAKVKINRLAGKNPQAANKAASKIAALFRGNLTRKRNPKPKNIKIFPTNTKLFNERIFQKGNQIGKLGGELMPQDESTTPYLRALLYPELASNARIPSEYPLQTATYHRHATIRTTTNASGNLVFIWDPVFMGASGETYSSFAVANNAGINLTTPDNTTGYVFQNLTNMYPPTNVYTGYRLVSASMRVLSNTSLTSATGLIGIGTAAIDVVNALNPTYGVLGIQGTNIILNTGNYTVQSNLDQLQYFKQSNVAVQEEARSIYYPLDPTYLTFISPGENRPIMLNAVVPTFVITGYCANFPASSSVTFEIDINIECTVDPLSKGYISLAMSKENVPAGGCSKIVTADFDNVTQTGMSLNTIIEKKESSFWDELGNTATTLGKAALKWLPTLFL